MILSDGDKAKFRAWLEQEIATNRLLMGQMDLLPVGQHLKRLYQMRETTYKMVLADLSAEAQTLSGEEGQ